MNSVERNVSREERTPRVLIAVGAALAAAAAPTIALKTALLAASGILLTTVATGYCPLNAALGRGEPEAEWQTIRTWRVET